MQLSWDWYLGDVRTRLPYRPLQFAVNKPSKIDPLSDLEINHDGKKFMVGDVIQVMRGPGVSRDLEGKFFRVLSIKDGVIQLSLPYEDRALIHRYRPHWMARA